MENKRTFEVEGEICEVEGSTVYKTSTIIKLSGFNSENYDLGRVIAPNPGRGLEQRLWRYSGDDAVVITKDSKFVLLRKEM